MFRTSHCLDFAWDDFDEEMLLSDEVDWEDLKISSIWQIRVYLPEHGSLVAQKQTGSKVFRNPKLYEEYAPYTFNWSNYSI